MHKLILFLVVATITLLLSNFLLTKHANTAKIQPMSLINHQATALPEELGAVHWLRSFKTAQAESKRQQKPILVLFQEVPGCATCTRYGNQVLRHPLLVDAIESLFVPVAIYNNTPGDDAETLHSFGEPAWNNP